MSKEERLREQVNRQITNILMRLDLFRGNEAGLEVADEGDLLDLIQALEETRSIVVDELGSRDNGS